MATATKARPKTAPTKGKTTPKASPKASAAKTQGIDELSALAGANKEYEDAERAKTGSQNSFITLAQGNSGILLADDPSYIKGVKLHDYVIAKNKLRLGAALDVTILGMFKLYAETAKKQKETDMAKTVSFWMPEDAMAFPIAGVFDRPLPNGNILQPVHWVFVYLHDHPEVEDGLIAFRSVGNKVYSALEKLVKAESSLCTELRFQVTKQAIKNETFKKTNYYPKFEITGRNFKYQDGKVVLFKDGLDRETLAEVLTRSKAVQEAYAKMRLVAKKNVSALSGPAPRAALPSGEGPYEEVGGDEGVQF